MNLRMSLCRVMIALGFLTFGCARVGNSGGAAGGTGGSTADGPPPPTPDAQDLAVDKPGPATDGAPPPSQGCVNLQCQQVSCPAGTATTVSGTTFAPNGLLPLYNVMVYVPNAPLTPFTPGVTCDRCGGSAPVRAVASAISDEHGKFRITNVPAGKNIPMVFQVGKWRRQVTLDNVVACQDNPIASPNLSRLPRNRQEGDLPRIAVTTGDCDFLGCLLPQVGVDLNELGIAGQDRAVTFYKGRSASGTLDQPPTGATNATQLWQSEAELSRYDIALLSCECEEVLGNKGPLAYAAMSRYLAKGGRIFGTDFMYVWYRSLTDPKLTSAISVRPPPTDDTDREILATPMLINTSFPKGKALADWMQFLEPLAPYGQIMANQQFDNIAAVTAPPVQVWASSMPSTAATAGPRIFSINTPVGVPAEQQCGRAVHMDAHIGPAVPPGLPVDFRFTFDALCRGGLPQGEQALAFMFFDLAGCIQEDSRPIIPPIIIP